jgi:hypothetical protein
LKNEIALEDRGISKTTSAKQLKSPWMHDLIFFILRVSMPFSYIFTNEKTKTHLLASFKNLV